jgi:hypothetical protein
MVAHSKFRDKLYTQFEKQYSEERPNKRVFGRANSGFVFQAAQAVDPDSSPLMLLFMLTSLFPGNIVRITQSTVSACLRRYL